MTKKAQLVKFKEAAREIGASESERQFDRTLKRLAKAPAEPKAKSGKKVKS